MPIPAVIAPTALNYQFNSKTLRESVSDLSPDEWLRSPDDKLNHIVWIVGHMAYCRGRILHFIGTEWAPPELNELFNRGSKLQPGSVYPSPEWLLNTWSESGHAMAHAFENISENLLAQPATQGPPSLDGKLSGMLGFMAIHETYHLGQISYLRGWLGHKGLMG
jgi:uncharacterized damage-inducible protein DinB